MTSLRRRLLFTIGVSLLALWSLVAVWMFVGLRSEMRSALDERLAASARMVAGLVSQMPAAAGSLDSRAGQLVDVIARDGLACEVSLIRGEVTVQTLGRTSASPGLGDAAPGYGMRVFGGKLWRTFVLQEGGVRVATADRMDVRETLLRDIGLTAGIPFAVALVGSLLMLWFSIGRGLAPIESIRAQLAARRPEDDGPLPATQVPSELRPLVETIAHLLARVRGTIARERSFTDDAAHELRTPLTAIKTHLQVMQLASDRGQDPATVAQAMVQASQGVLRMQRTLEQLLLLARLDGEADAAADGGASAGAAAMHAVQVAEAAHGSRGRVILEGAEQSMVVMIPDALLVCALRNLLDNALRFAPDASPVILRVEPVGPDRCRFSVLDEGPGLSDAECARALERFWRQGRTPHGSGLGLSIVSSIAKRCAGSISLSTRGEGGLCAILTLPVQQTPG
jgi:two-component system sensor histidine kinase QseC